MIESNLKSFIDNLHAIKFILLKNMLPLFLVYSMLGIHHHSLILEYFILCKRNPLADTALKS